MKEEIKFILVGCLMIFVFFMTIFLIIFIGDKVFANAQQTTVTASVAPNPCNTCAEICQEYKDSLNIE